MGCYTPSTYSALCSSSWSGPRRERPCRLRWRASRRPPCTRLVAIGDVIEARGGADYAGCRIDLDHPPAEGSWLRPWRAVHERALYDDYGRTNIIDGV